MPVDIMPRASLATSLSEMTRFRYGSISGTGNPRQLRLRLQKRRSVSSNASPPKHFIREAHSYFALPFLRKWPGI